MLMPDSAYIQELWRPVVEITILTIAIYYILIFVRGTTRVAGGHRLRGNAGACHSISDLAASSNVLALFLQTFFAASAFAALVIFQPELRRMLAELGNLPLFNTAREQRENIEVIIQSVERMSEVRIGSIIAIQQTIQLQDVVESGIVVDCEATPEMLETIFFPNNAIHDGGVILVGDRIAFAACIFPLTQRQDLAKSLGTRHRAAIGLTEETDAVVVVVSEETGAISYAYKGHLVRNVTAEELRAFLTSVFVRRSKRSVRVREWIRARLKPRAKEQSSMPAAPLSQHQAE